MNSSYENKLQKSAGRRKFPLKIMLYVLAAAVLLIVALCLYVTQPLIRIANVSTPISVDPTRLETRNNRLA